MHYYWPRLPRIAKTAGLTPSEIVHTRHPTNHRDNMTVHAYRVYTLQSISRIYVYSSTFIIIIILFHFYIIYLASIRYTPTVYYTVRHAVVAYPSTSDMA